MLKAMLLAGMGGFVGTCLRFIVGKLCHAIAVTTFPWGTFVVNVVGSLLIGIFFGLAERGNVISASMNVFLITGFCGGFTTFSSFSDDIYLLLQQRHWVLGAVYVVSSLTLGLAMVWAGRDIVSGK